jgi:hypothetical protein
MMTTLLTLITLFAFIGPVETEPVEIPKSCTTEQLAIYIRLGLEDRIAELCEGNR